MTIDVETAAQLLDFGARLGGGARALEQLEGAVAIHNVLEQHGVAYLADEVGMGKTYVTLGVIALFRHFNPDFRVLVLAPRANIQRKWQKERDAFIANNIRFADLRNRAPDGRPALPSVHCERLLDLLREGTLGANRDFFCRLTSFSLAVGGQDASRATAQQLRMELRQCLPWISTDLLDARNKIEFKDNLARLLCCGLPKFDLVVVDEAHNLKHGFAEGVAARNRVLGLMMGREALAASDAKRFPGYDRRAQRVLFLSATPVEDTYRHLWNQLNVFGVAGPFGNLLSDSEAEARAAAEQFLIRRVTRVAVGGEILTRNLYRREWRQGGVQTYDTPIEVNDDRQRLVLALVQKKVAELLGHERFGGAFQMGMLASFESFEQTTLRENACDADPDASNFDDGGQTQDELAREGIDVHLINDIARSYKARFGEELPHPKMDAVASVLTSAWTTGEKALVFVRRVASVKELKQKLDDAYDEWLTTRLRSTLPEGVLRKFDAVLALYAKDRRRDHEDSKTAGPPSNDTTDGGGRDTFFAWFFRGEGPKSVLSGANMQSRFLQRATVFDDNALAWILQCPPGALAGRLKTTLGLSRDALALKLGEEVRYFLGDAKRHRRDDAFIAVQAAACSLLRSVDGEHIERARAVWHARWEPRRRSKPVASHVPDVLPLLSERTFFDALAHEPDLSRCLWPTPTSEDVSEHYRERFLRAQLLASATRLGHGLIDVYGEVIGVLRTLEAGRVGGDDGEEASFDIVVLLIGLLSRQRGTPRAERNWGLFDELSAIAENFELILDVNAHDVRQKSLTEASVAFGRLLREQRPVAGMSGGVNQTSVQQFRMPGYPFVLISTDVLQEGEDLHTFCATVHHYGISWTPSSMEQRTGRIDRVRSKFDRNLSTLEALTPDDKLQVHFPYLQGTVEVLQVRRVLERMDTFIRLMHEGLSVPATEGRSINVNDAIHTRGPMPAQPLDVLRTAFPIRPSMLRGRRRTLDVQPDHSASIASRFAAIPGLALGVLQVEWEPSAHGGRLMGTARVGSRIQPFTLLLGAVAGRAIVRCISPVGRVNPDADPSEIESIIRAAPVKIGVIPVRDAGTYDVTVQGEVLLANRSAFDAGRVEALIARVVRHADAVEQRMLAGRDAPLSAFRADLAKETAFGA